MIVLLATSCRSENYMLIFSKNKVKILAGKAKFLSNILTKQ